MKAGRSVFLCLKKVAEKWRKSGGTGDGKGVRNIGHSFRRSCANSLILSIRKYEKGVPKSVPKSVPKGVGRSVPKGVPTGDGNIVGTGVGKSGWIGDGDCGSTAVPTSPEFPSPVSRRNRQQGTNHLPSGAASFSLQSIRKQGYRIKPTSVHHDMP